MVECRKKEICSHFKSLLTNLLTSHLSINAIALQKSGMSYLNKKKILEPLEYLLPDKVEAIVKEVTEQNANATSKNERNSEKGPAVETTIPAK